MRNRPVKIIALVLSFALLAVPFLTGCNGETQVPRQEIPVRRGNIEILVSADGNLSLIRDRKLTFGTSGTVTEINVNEGDTVTEGQVLARLDTGTLELAINTAEIAVKAAAIDVEIASSAYEKITYPYDYHTFAISIPDSLAAIGDALNRIETLKGEISASMSTEQLIEVRDNLKEATDRLADAQNKLRRGQGPDLFLSGQLPPSAFWTIRDAQLNLDKVNLALDRAGNELKRSQDELPKTVITAPFSGLIAQSNLKVGDKLSAAEYNSRVVFELIDPDQLELRATVDEIDIAMVVVGQKAVITLDSLPETEPAGEVTFISPLSRTEGGVVVYDVKISIDASQYPGMKSGMTAKADIVTDRKENVITVPERAIYQNADGKTAVKVLVNGNVEERVIATGISNGIDTEVSSGINEGETLVIERRTSTT